MRILALGIVNNLQFSIVEDEGTLRGQLLFNHGTKSLESIGKIVKDILSNFKSTIKIVHYHNWQKVIKSEDNNRVMFFGDAADFKIVKDAEAIITIYGQPDTDEDEILTKLNFISKLINDIVERNALKLADKMIKGEEK